MRKIHLPNKTKFDFEVTVNFGLEIDLELDVTVIGNWYAGCPATRHHPGDPEEVEWELFFEFRDKNKKRILIPLSKQQCAIVEEQFNIDEMALEKGYDSAVCEYESAMDAEFEARRYDC